VPLVLSAFLHRLDPYVLGPFGGLGLRWYGLAYVAGFAAGFWLLRTLARRRRTPLEPARLGDFVFTVALGTIAGGRLGYCVLYRPDLFTDVSASIPFWGVLAFHKGGMASHGGMVGMLLACLWFARRRGVPALHLLDLVVFAAPIGIFFGRMANFVNGELYGRPCAPELPWAVKFPQEILAWGNAAHAGHAKLASSDFQAVLKAAGAPAGDLERVVEAVRTNDAVARALEPLLTPRHPSQLYEAVLEGFVLFALLAWIWRAPRKPGVLAGWFLIAYAIVRFIAEEFRMPDAHVGFQWLGLTRGQWLSAWMLAAGIACLIAWARRPAAPLGGWRGPSTA